MRDRAVVNGGGVPPRQRFDAGVAALETEVELLQRELSQVLARMKRIQRRIQTQVAQSVRWPDVRTDLTDGGRSGEDGARQALSVEATRAGVTEGLRTVVVQIALSGSTREEIAEWLQENLGIPDAREVVEAALDGE